MSFARNRLMQLELPPAWQAGTIVLSLVLAWASWRLVEHPFRAGSAPSQGRIFALSGAGMTVLGTAAVAVVATSGVERRYTPEQVALLRSLEYAPEIRACRGVRGVADLCTFGAADGDGRRWLLWGDSHAEALLPAVDALAGEAGATLDFASEAACAPLPGLIRSDRDPGQRRRCMRFTDRLTRHAQQAGYDTVILHARWPLYVEDDRHPSGSERPSVLAAVGEAFAADATFNPKLVETALAKLLDRLTSAGLRVVLVGPVPEQPFDVGQGLKAAVLHDMPMPSAATAQAALDRQAATVPLLAEVAARAGATLVSLTTEFCSATCPSHDGLTAFYRDNNHLTPAGATTLALPALRAGWPAP